MIKEAVTPPRALLPVDLQNDPCVGGAFTVPEGDSMVGVVNCLIDWCRSRDEAVIASQDWHPTNHNSFASQRGVRPYIPGQFDGLPQTFWPGHCVQNSEGAQSHPLLHQRAIVAVFHKGENPLVDSYGAFFNNGRQQKTPPDDRLHDHETDELIVMSLATDYCVEFIVLNALQLGYKIDVTTDGRCGVNIQPQGSAHAFMEMPAAGATPYTLTDWERIQG